MRGQLARQPAERTVPTPRCSRLARRAAAVGAARLLFAGLVALATFGRPGRPFVLKGREADQLAPRHPVNKGPRLTSLLEDDDAVV